MEQIELKAVLIGNTNVGKTCIVRMATTGIFDDDTTTTLGASYSAKSEVVDNKLVRLQIWDTAGQEKYRGMTPMYYHNAQLAIIVYSITDSESFNSVDQWAKSLQENADSDIVVFLVGNKVDIEDDRKVSTDDGQNKAQQIGAEFCEVSARSGLGIADLFGLLPRVYFERKPAVESSQPVVELEETQKEKKNTKCC